MALKRDGEYNIFFVITLEAGRLRPEDTETMKLVLEAAPIKDKYTIVINKATPAAVRAFQNPAVLEDLAASTPFFTLLCSVVSWGSVGR